MSPIYHLAETLEASSLSRVQYIDTLYARFLIEIVEPPAPWAPNNSIVKCRWHDSIENRHGGFWHCVSGGDSLDHLRNLDPARCQRLHWIRPMIDEFNRSYTQGGPAEIVWWVSSRNSTSPRYLLATPDFSYIVIIDQRIGFALLVTAYHLESERRRKKFEKEYLEYLEKIKQGPPA